MKLLTVLFTKLKILISMHICPFNWILYKHWHQRMNKEQYFFLVEASRSCSSQKGLTAISMPSSALKRGRF